MGLFNRNNNRGCSNGSCSTGNNNMYQQQPSYTSSRCSNPYQGAVIPTRQGYCGNVVQSSCGSVQSHNSEIKPDHDTEALLKNGNITMKDGKIEFGAKIPSATVIEYNYVPKGMNVSTTTTSRDISQDTTFSTKTSTGDYTISGENSKNDPSKKNIRVNISEGVGVFNIKINGQKYQIDRATVEKHFKNKEVAPSVPDEAKKERKNETAAKPDEAKSEAKETTPDGGFLGGLFDRVFGRNNPMPVPSVEAPKPMPVPSVEPPKSEAPKPMPVPSVEPPKPMPVPSVEPPKSEAPKPMPVPNVEPPKPMPVPSVEPPKSEASTSIPAPKVEASASIPTPKVEVSNEAKEIELKTNPALREAVRYRPKHTGYNDAGTFTPESESYMTKKNTDGSVSMFYVPKVSNVPSGVEARSNIILEHNDKKGFREIKVEGPKAQLSAWSEAKSSDMAMITSSYSHNYEKTRRIPSPKVETKLANISDLFKEVVSERPDYLGYSQGGKKVEQGAPYLTRELDNGSKSSFYVPSVTSGMSKTILEFNTKEGFRALSLDGKIGEWSPTTIDQMPEILQSYSDKKQGIPAPKVETKLANISDLFKEVVSERPDYLGYSQGGKKVEQGAPYLTKELENGSKSSFYVPSVTSGMSKTILEFNTKEGFRALSLDGTIGDWSPTTIDQMPEIIKSYSDKKRSIPAPKIERQRKEDTKGSEYT